MSYVHNDFPGMNKKVVCTINDFLQKLAISQKLKIADLHIL